MSKNVNLSEVLRILTVCAYYMSSSKGINLLYCIRWKSFRAHSSTHDRALHTWCLRRIRLLQRVLAWRLREDGWGIWMKQRYGYAQIGLEGTLLKCEERWG